MLTIGWFSRFSASSFMNAVPCLIGTGLLMATSLQAATLTVTTLEDLEQNDGLCSLSEAIISASSNINRFGDCGNAGEPDPATDIITFDDSLWTLGNTALITLNPFIGRLPDLVGNVEIRPRSVIQQRRVRVVGNGNARILRILRPADDRQTTTLIDRMEFQNGYVLDGVGGGLRIEAGLQVTLRNCRFFDHTAVGNGAAVGVFEELDEPNALQPGVLRIQNCRFDNNTAERAGGLLSFVSGVPHSVVIENSVFDANVSDTVPSTIYISNDSSQGSSSVDSRLENVQVLNGVSTTSTFLDALGHTTIRQSRTDGTPATPDLVIRDYRAEGNSAVSAGVGLDVRIFENNALLMDRLTIRNNSGQVYSAIFAQAFQLELRNSLIADNRSMQRALSTFLRAKEGHLVGNTFLRNGSTNDVSNVDEPADTLFLESWDSIGSQFTLAGNILIASNDLPQSATQCRAEELVTITAQNNASNRADCAFGTNSVLDAGLSLVETERPGELHSLSAVPSAGSPLIDLWADGSCRDRFGNALDTDLIGDRRDGSGTPFDGDGVPPANCDAGAFELPSVALVSVSTTGIGSVASTPAGIDCGAECEAPFPIGETVELAASPGQGYVFSAWTGDCGGSGPCTLDIDGPQVVQAEFERGSFVEVTVDGQGQVVSSPAGIDCPGDCAETFESDGASTELSATPAPGWRFDGWSGDCTGTATCSLPTDSDQAVTATFSQGDALFTDRFEGLE